MVLGLGDGAGGGEGGGIIPLCHLCFVCVFFPLESIPLSLSLSCDHGLKIMRVNVRTTTP